MTAVPNLFGSRDLFCGRQFFHGQGFGGGAYGSGGNAAMGRDGEWQAYEASPARPLLTSCCAARFLTGRGPILVHSPGGWGPLIYETKLSFADGDYFLWPIFSAKSYQGFLSIWVCECEMGMGI